MPQWPVHGTITGPIVMIGFGSIGRGTLPLIERHFKFDKSRFTVIDPEDKDRHLLDARGIAFIKKAVRREDFVDLLKPLLTRGGGQAFVVNLSIEVSSAAIMRLCHEVGALYIDTVAEPWPGFYTDARLTASERSNYALREGVLDLRRALGPGPAAISCCGANPGMVSWFVKQALLNVAADCGIDSGPPSTREDWARLAQKAGRMRYPARGGAKAARRFCQYLVGRGLYFGGSPARRTRLGNA
jgi:homospermidine synthase